MGSDLHRLVQRTLLLVMLLATALLLVGCPKGGY
jgi:hypothetical protein